MSGRSFPPCPPSLKPIQHYLKAAAEHDDRDIIISYWSRLYAFQLGLKLDRSSPEAKKLLGHLMDWLEKTKAEHRDNESISNDIPAQAHLENYAFRLFVWADSQDRTGIFNRNVVKAFYTAGLIYDVLDTFGDVSDDVVQNRKYAKWKAAYIHNCLKNGETPVPGPLDDNLNEPSSSSMPAFNPKTRGSTLGSLGLTDSVGVPSVSTIKPVPTQETISHFDLKSEKDDKDDKEDEKDDKADKEKDDFEPSETPSTTKMQLSPEQMNKAQKYCKWAASALNYDDIPTAVANLQKALQLLTTGIDAE